MSDTVRTADVGGPAVAARPLVVPKVRVSRRLVTDRLARRLVALGGIAIVASILAILVVIAVEVYPLATRPSTSLIRTVSTQIPGGPILVGVDEYREVAYLVTGDGIVFVSLEDGSILSRADVSTGTGRKVVASSALGRGPFALSLSDGRVVPVEVTFSVSYPEGKRRIEPELVIAEPITADPGGRAVMILAHAAGPGGPITAVASGPKALTLISIQERKALVGPSTKEEARQQISLPIEGEISALALDGRGEDVFVGTASGEVVRIDLRDPAEPRIVETVSAASRPGAGITTMGFLIGDRTLVAGDQAGGVSSWQLLRTDEGEFRLKRIYDFAPHEGPVVAFSASRRDKGFITADASGVVSLRYGTTGETLLTVRGEEGGLRAVSYAPKADGLVAAGADGRLSNFAVRNPHPEITWRGLFGKIWYEGYPEPDYVWQSTGGTDDFEAKFSLTPLVYGTLKGTFYALLFALPLALLGALYTSQFMHPALKAIVKPVVEVMAALPSVVLGFLAGLWLAPRVEKVVPGIFLMPIVVSAVVLIAVVVWRAVPLKIRTGIKPGSEIFLLLPLIPVGAWLAIQLGGALEGATMGGDYRTWLLSVLGLTYDQRNSLVVGIAMGFAVIPIIFTIAEDALSGVPQSLAAGSLALGATRWQTALRVVVPTASPGIFSAVMIGLGRAVGETMIVLMATGNTPVMDWSIFSGFRAMSANIAVELPEAPHAGTLYRVLFLAALLLFVMTSIVNTAAEVVRLRLRKRYQAL
jgi:phosphate transport system permease protein